VEVTREHLLPVLGRDHLRELDNGGHAQATVPEWLNGLGEVADEPGGLHPVVGGAVGEPELALEEGKERRELLPEFPPVELRERDDELGERVALVAEEVDETVRELTRSVHGEHYLMRFQSLPERARSSVAPRSVASERARGPTRIVPQHGSPLAPLFTAPSTSPERERHPPTSRPRAR